MRMFSRKPVAALLGAASAAALCIIMTSPAAAQFVCVGNATGALVPPATADGAGATAAGSANNVACGTTANATGVNSNNTATGSGANASGTGGVVPITANTATGFSSNAVGNNSTN